MKYTATVFLTILSAAITYGAIFHDLFATHKTKDDAYITEIKQISIKEATPRKITQNINRPLEKRQTTDTIDYELQIEQTFDAQLFSSETADILDRRGILIDDKYISLPNNQAQTNDLSTIPATALKHFNLSKLITKTETPHSSLPELSDNIRALFQLPITGDRSAISTPHSIYAKDQIAAKNTFMGKTDLNTENTSSTFTPLNAPSNLPPGVYSQLLR